MSPAPAPGVFISYRREDAAGHAGRLYDAIAERLGDANVFMDVALAPGLDFVASIERAVASCQVLLVVMGPRWATVAKADGRPRLGLEDDYVRLEVETGVRRDDVTVIPVLVGGARMPEPAGLPPGLRALTRRNALEVSDGRWRYDAGRLLEAVERALGEATVAHDTLGHEETAEVVPAPRARPVATGAGVGTPNPAGSLLPAVAAAALVAAVAGVVGRLVAGGVTADHPSGDSARLVQAVVLRALPWAAVAAALAVLVATRVHRPLLPAVLIGATGGVLAGLAGTLDWLAGGTSFAAPDGDLAGVLHALVLPLILAAIGGVVGGLWRPRHVALGLAAGLVAGALARVLAGKLWHVDHPSEQVLVLAPQAAFLGALVWLAVLEAEERPAAARDGATPVAWAGGRPRARP